MPAVQVGAGWLLQEADSLVPEDITFECVSEAQPTEQQLEDLKFAWRCVKHVKSNAITIAKDSKLLGMGSGQPNRVNSVRIALEKVRFLPRLALPSSGVSLPL
jgi:phosphoribosylaminoimidazolecarboxamide formyltransferase/IMP cyclohydrolase